MTHPSKYHNCQPIACPAIFSASGDEDTTTGELEPRGLVLLSEKFHAGVPGALLWKIAIQHELIHPNIAQMHSAWLSPDSQLFLAYELIEMDLPNHISLHPRHEYGPQTLKRMFQQLLSGIAFAHSKQIVHGSLTPHSVLITRQGIVKIVCFGFHVCLQTDAALYKAPEMMSGTSAQPTLASDMWAAGCLFAFMANRGNFYLPILLKHDVTVVNSFVSQGIVCEMNPSTKSLWSQGLADLQKPALDLLKGLLHIDPTKRLTAKQALKHSYFDDERSLTNNPPQNTIQNSNSNLHHQSPISAFDWSHGVNISNNTSTSLPQIAAIQALLR